MSIGNCIKKHRKDKGLTQKKLGELVGISEVMVGQYERGIRNPKYEMLKQIATALNISIEDLVDTNSGYYKVNKIIDKLNIFEKQLEYLGYIRSYNSKCLLSDDNENDGFVREIYNENYETIGCNFNNENYYCSSCKLGKQYILIDVKTHKKYYISMQEFNRLEEESFSYLEFKVQELIKKNEELSEKVNNTDKE